MLGGMTTTLTPARLAWLTEQVDDWRSAGVLSPDQAETILGQYAAGRRLGLVRLLLGIGATFVGVGVLWLVAANLESFSPGARVVFVAVLWAAALGGAETLAARGVSGAVVGAARLVAALLVGALIFQAAQTLQVPAYEPLLVGAWAAAALLHAYAVGARAPLVVGVVAGATFVVWSTLDSQWSGLGFVIALALVGLVALALAALHGSWLPAFAPLWREAGALLVLVAVTVGVLPFVTTEGWTPGPGTWALLAATMALAAAGALRGSSLDRIEVGVAAVALVGTVALVLWEAGSGGRSDLDGAAVLHAVLGIALCAGVAVALAVDGTLRDSSRLVALATAALVLVTTLQAFTVFAPVLEGAWLFLLLGAVLVGTALTFDQGRRRLAAAL